MAVKMSDLKEWGITKILSDMMCDEPFGEEMMIDIKKTYRTRDGQEVRIYATDTGGAKKAIHGAVKLKDGWYMLAWSKNGIVSNVDRNLDLIEVCPRHKQTVWLNVYEDSKPALHLSKELADQYRCDRIACIKVELDYAEGDGL